MHSNRKTRLQQNRSQLLHTKCEIETLNLFFPAAATLLYLSWLVQQKEGNLGENNGKRRSTCCMVNRGRTRSDWNREISQQNFNNTLPPSSSFRNLSGQERTRTRSYRQWPFATQLHSPVWTEFGQYGNFRFTPTLFTWEISPTRKMKNEKWKKSKMKWSCRVQ